MLLDRLFNSGLRLVQLLLLVLVSQVFLSSSVFAATVKDVRVWRAPDHTRVVLDLSSPTSHKIMQLANPDRIVIDINNASLKADLNSLELPDSPVSRVRSAVKGKHDLRVVLDVNSKVKPRSFLLKANKQLGDRLVVDLYDKKKTSQVVKHIDDNKKRDIVIAIDAGHGGEDPGASGPNRLREKHVVLAIAKELNYLLKKEKGYKPVMIRTGDYYVGLKTRRGLARKAQADLMVSIHADAFSDPRAHGTSVYALSRRGATSAMAQALADDANNSDLVGGVSLSDKDDVLAGVLADLSMGASLDISTQLGKGVIGEMGKISRLHSRKVELANFSVLRSADVPSILVETGFISNPGEEKKLKTKAYQRKMSRAIYNGIVKHFSNSPPQDTYLAWKKRQRDKTINYVVTRGDTLSGIAKRYQVSVNSIRRENDLASSVIKVGQRIVIPSS
ncbi:N-acetylmuramoyl-L-alanine amidase [Oceanicoccus sagamiensis]|uniref:N-acetylmuramoyl-L-alanine amidase AmiC n=1 Tax=Oceanicoccus sagamiensis TaxID=716816 RepID=A0A1X9N8G4_9GAMM|nr:N-acetylmuramoyl-L-alanine amidase [Oceanicoccus sagamiensis]ARN74358.1 N-acetylmuramoyl-L-alanine amidase [Oceanicoccus sagamiensis]